MSDWGSERNLGMSNRGMKEIAPSHFSRSLPLSINNDDPIRLMVKPGIHFYLRLKVRPDLIPFLSLMVKPDISLSSLQKAMSGTMSMNNFLRFCIIPMTVYDIMFYVFIFVIMVGKSIYIFLNNIITINKINPAPKCLSTTFHSLPVTMVTIPDNMACCYVFKIYNFFFSHVFPIKILVSNDDFSNM